MNTFDLNYIGVDELVEDELIDVNGGQIITTLLAFLGATLTIGGIAVPAYALILAAIAGVAGISAVSGMAGMLLY